MLKRVGIALVAALCCLCAAAGAQEEAGQFFDTFVNNYNADVEFINDNTGRHLLPLLFTATLEGGKPVYRASGGSLNAEVRVDVTGELIERCRIELTAPMGMTYGSEAYRDFTTSGYQSYAMLMAMDKSPESLERYALVERVNAGLAATSEGQYFAKVGAYDLTCTSRNSVATLEFALSTELTLQTGGTTVGEPETWENWEGDEEGDSIG